MRFTFNWLFVMWLAGIGIAILSSYYLLVGLYQVITWDTATGTIIEIVVDESGEELTYYSKAEFIAPTGGKIEVVANTGVSERDELYMGEVTILYDPANPSNAIIFQLADYLIVLFLPFAALLIYLGWPFGVAPHASN